MVPHRRLPTDRRILVTIYDHYHDAFTAYSDESKTRSCKIYVPIDIGAIARLLKVDGDIVFGRLYYHLERRYGYRNRDGSHVHFFARRVGEDTHCVNFPLLASVLADLQDQSRKHWWAIGIAVGSFFVSVASLVIALLGAGSKAQ